MRPVFLLLCAGSVSVGLQGCGGGGTATATATTTTTTTVTTVTTLPPSPPRPGHEVADLMNREYNGYTPGDPSSPFGNWIRMSTDLSDKLGIFCEGACFQGKPDCRVTGSVYNRKQMLDPNTGSPGGWYGSISGSPLTGFYVNSTLIKTRLGKCLYAWDGASDNRVNNGCGCGQGTASCNDKHSAYYNKVPPEYTETSSGNSSNVAKCSCDSLSKDQWPKGGDGAKCFWKGVAFDTASGVDTPDETHTMLDWRTANQQGSGNRGPLQLVWNEFILDGHRMLEALRQDPAGTVVATVYSGTPGMAQSIAKKFAQVYNLPSPLPVIRLDTHVDGRTGNARPWVFSAQDQASSFEVAV